MIKFKEKIGEEAFKELEKIIRRELDIRNTTDLEASKKALALLQEWLTRVYELDHAQLIAPEFSLEGMFVTREDKLNPQL